MVFLFLGTPISKTSWGEKKSYIGNPAKETLENVTTQVKIHFVLSKEHSCKCCLSPASFLVETGKYIVNEYNS